MSLDNWRNKCSNLIEEQLYMLDNEIDSDCIIIVYENDVDIVEPSEQNQISIKAHKLILKTVSPVFEVMLSGKYVENMDGMIKITDIRPSIMKKFLRFIYGQKDIDDDEELENILELIFASTKYDIARLSQMFHSFFKQKFLKIEYVPRINNLLVNKTSDPIFETIKNEVFQIIQQRTKEYLDLENALEITEEDLIKIVQADDLSLNCESELIEFVNNWAHYQLQKNSVEVIPDNLRKLLIKNIIPNLRVLTVTPEMYKKTVDTCTWFTLEEKLAILKFVINMVKLDDISLSVNICKATSKRCSNPLIVSVPKKCCFIYPRLVSFLILDPRENIEIFGIQVDPKLKINNFKAEENDTNAYNESLTVTIGILDEENDIKKFSFKGLVSYNSVINIKFNRTVKISNNFYYSLKLTTDVAGEYPEDQNIFGNDAFIFLCDIITLQKSNDDFVSFRPEIVRNIIFNVSSE